MDCDCATCPIQLTCLVADNNTDTDTAVNQLLTIDDVLAIAEGYFEAYRQTRIKHGPDPMIWCGVRQDGEILMMSQNSDGSPARLLTAVQRELIEQGADWVITIGEAEARIGPVMGDQIEQQPKLLDFMAELAAATTSLVCQIEGSGAGVGRVLLSSVRPDGSLGEIYRLQQLDGFDGGASFLPVWD